MEKKISILIAKPGLDGHDKGAKIIFFALKEAGMDVVYSGLHQSLDAIMLKAQKEHVDVVGLSIMSGAHLSICEAYIKELKKRKIENTKLLIGGIIPKKDVKKLTDMGVDAVFPNGTKINTIVESIQALF